MAIRQKEQKRVPRANVIRSNDTDRDDVEPPPRGSAYNGIDDDDAKRDNKDDDTIQSKSRTIIHVGSGDMFILNEHYDIDCEIISYGCRLYRRLLD